ncbi:MAG: flagellar basal-body rod protein FlgF [archaeon]|nr:flagellar basal-body rod protein FlgF [archaeon]
MVRGLYTAATSMQVQMNKMDVITNNMANADTIGYKKDVMAQESFSSSLAKRIDELGETKIGKMKVGVGTTRVATNFETGNLKNTGGALDVAIEGTGFLVVDTKRGERYTRMGDLTLDAEGYLKDANGDKVKDDTDNDIIIPSGGNITISTNGVITVDGNEIAKLQIVDFEDLNYLEKEGNGLYKTMNGATEKEFTGNIRQGFVEGSNVNIVKEMVNMISLNRNYEANQKVIQTHDSLMDKAVNDVGRL